LPMRYITLGAPWKLPCGIPGVTSCVTMRTSFSGAQSSAIADAIAPHNAIMARLRVARFMA